MPGLDPAANDAVSDGARAGRGAAAWIAAVLALAFVYPISSGPVLAAAFWLREATGREGFYSAMWLYAPLLVLGGPDGPVAQYVEWWCELFDTVGPG